MEVGITILSNNLQKTHSWSIEARQSGERLDRFISRFCGSRASIAKNIACVLVNGSQVKKSYRIQEKDKICYQVRTQKALTEQNLGLQIVYEDAYLLVVNKPPGLVVHPVLTHNHEKTLVEGLLNKLKNHAPFQDLRPGIVHRLDKDACGLMVVAKDPKTQQTLKHAFQAQKIQKWYEVLVQGKTPLKGQWKTKIGRDPKHRKRFQIKKAHENGKEALTNYWCRHYYVGKLGVYSLLTVQLITGRTHQIRTHSSGHGYPVAGDLLYGGKYTQKGKNTGLALCARGLGFPHPKQRSTIKNVTGRMYFQIPRPDYFEHILLDIQKR